MFNYSKTKKLIVLVLFVSVLVPSTFFANPKKAEAIFGIGDIVFDPSVFVQIATDTFREEVLNAIAWNIAKAAVAQITQQTVNWINTGFDGNPLYINNLDNYYAFICTETFNSFMQELSDDTQVSPEEKRIIARSLLASRPCQGERTVTNPKTIADEVLEDYYRDFRRGGWSVWQRQITNPANNIYGQYSRSRAELNSRLRSEAYNTEQELDWGQGFLSARECDATDEAGNCTNYKIVTPGSLIEERLVKATNSDIEQLNLADSINEIANALLGQLIGEIFSAGGKLFEDNGNSYESRTVNPFTITEPNETQTIRKGGALVSQILNSDIQVVETYKETLLDARDIVLDITAGLLRINNPAAPLKVRAEAEIDGLLPEIDAEIERVNALLAGLQGLQPEAATINSSAELTALYETISDLRDQTQIQNITGVQDKIDTLEALLFEIEVYNGDKVEKTAPGI